MQYPQASAPFPPPQPQVREKRKFGKLAAIFLSFFSAELYRDIGRRWRGIGFWYLVLLMLLTCIPTGIEVQYKFREFVKSDMSGLIDTFPTITYDSKHEISVAESDPYLWKDPKTGEVILYVDTTGKFDLPQGAKAPVKLSKTQLIMRQSPGETRTYQLSQYPPGPLVIDKNLLNRWAGIAQRYIGLGVFGFLFVFSVIGHFIQILIYGLIGLIFCAMFGARIDYAALLRMSAVAITPAVILGTALELSGVNFRGENWLYFALEMLVLGLAVKANAAGRSLPPTGFPMQAYPPGYGATAGGYPQPGYPQQGGYVAPPGQYPPPPPPMR
ncbi:MAG TPA: DUF1189 family protein [Tepidisphaeraceae bacterium]|jgi:hypothetical protein|nr:DUF1189 family protein [Tepidisphaeraceae bacterium]